MYRKIAIVAAALAAFSSAQAQELSVATPNSVIPNFDIQSVGPVLNELGVAWQAGKAENGQTFIGATVGGGLQFILAPTACRGEGESDCVGLNMVAIFDGNANPQTVQAFNYRYAFASAGLNPQGTAYLSRYEISDYGLPRGNLATSIMVFVNQVALFAKELDTARRTVSLEGYADDLASSQLNRQARAALTGVEAHAANAIEAHQIGLEEGAAYVREFIADTSLPRNKIKNLTSE